MNKIINVKRYLYTEKLKSTGGKPTPFYPQDLSVFKKLIIDLNSILESDDDTFNTMLIHRDDRNTILDKKLYVPPISKRITSLVPYIFGTKNIDYHMNVIMIDKENNENLCFIYRLTRDQIEHAVFRLKEIYQFISNEVKNRSLAEYLKVINEKSSSNNWQELERINNDLRLKLEKFISKSSIVELVWKVSAYYKSWTLNKSENEIFLEGSNITKCVVFPSEEIRKSEQNNVKDIEVIYSSSNLLFVKNKKNTKIQNGLFYFDDMTIKIPKSEKIKNNSDTLKSKNNSDSLESILCANLNENISKNDQKIGVIDGGISSDSPVLNYLKNYKKYRKEEDTDCHAEEVCSLILWANNIDKKRMCDNCRQPDVWLFDILEDNMNLSEFFQKFEDILKKHHEEIKIWNLSISFENWRNEESWKKGLTYYGHLFDILQKKYDVLFIIATGNKNNPIQTVIQSPSDAVFALTVASAFDKTKIPPYALSGQNNQNKFYSVKPDLASGGCDGINYSYKVLSDGIISERKGTSYAAPLVARKAAELLANNIDLHHIPAILNLFSSKNNDGKINDYIGNGILPMDVNEILNPISSKGLMLFKIQVSEYSEGFFKIKMPKDIKQNYDHSFYIGVNCLSNINKNCSFEHITDSVRVQFGCVDPNAQIDGKTKKNRLLTHKKALTISGNDDDTDERKKETELRSIFNKYKNRYTQIWKIQRAISGHSKLKNLNQSTPIDSFGFTFTRNDIKSKRVGVVDVYIALLIENINNNMDTYKNILDLNHDLITDVEFVNENIIKLED